MRREALVYLHGELCGLLCKTAYGYTFQYDANYVGMPLSISLPLSDEVYESNVLFPFFCSLAPEGWLLEMRSKGFNLDPQDKFGHLLRSGNDLLGAVTIQEKIDGDM